MSLKYSSGKKRRGEASKVGRMKKRKKIEIEQKWQEKEMREQSRGRGERGLEVRERTCRRKIFLKRRTRARALGRPAKRATL